MIKFITMLMVVAPLCANANDTEKKSSFSNNFEINQKNCNLPMKTIRHLLPNKDDQKKALEHCMEKATKERWKLQRN